MSRNYITILLFLVSSPLLAQFSERNNPFKGPQYQSDKEYIRVVAHRMGDKNPEILGDIAALHARAEMAEEGPLAINSQVEDIVKAIDNGIELKTNEAYEKLIQQQTSAVLRGSHVKETRELFSKKDKMYDVWVVVEMKRASLSDFTDDEIEIVRETLPQEAQERFKKELFNELWRKEAKK